MRAVLLVLLARVAGCSLVVPQPAWHPTTDLDGEWSCPSRAFPIADVTIGTAAALHGIAWRAPLEFVSAIPWAVSAAYGFVRGSSCRDELERRTRVYFAR